MAFGVNQGFKRFFTDSTLSESESIDNSLDVSLLTEAIFWVRNEATSPGNVEWILETKMDISQTLIQVDTEPVMAAGDEFGLQWFHNRNQPVTTYDITSGAVTIAVLTASNSVVPMQSLKLTVNSAATVGTYTINAGVLFRG